MGASKRHVQSYGPLLPQGREYYHLRYPREGVAVPSGDRPEGTLRLKP